MSHEWNLQYNRRKCWKVISLKKLTIGIVIGLLIGLSSNVFAAVGDRIEVIISQFTISVDGVEQELDADILNRDGTTYLPLRTIANMLGKDVVYKADTKGIELNTPESVEEALMVEEVEESIVIPAPVYTGPSIEDIQNNIARQEVMKKTYEGQLPHAPEEAKDGIIAEIEKISNKIAELESQKAALQAQQ